MFNVILIFEYDDKFLVKKRPVKSLAFCFGDLSVKKVKLIDASFQLSDPSLVNK